METSQSVESVSEPNYVAFRAANLDYCVGIMDVREIRSWAPTTPLPGSPEFINGVINLRGSVVPILDFSIRLGLPSSEPTERNVIVIVKVGDRTMGLLVDEVSEILNINDDSIKPTLDFGTSLSDTLIAGVIVLDERMIRLIDLNQMFVLSTSEVN